MPDTDLTNAIATNAAGPKSMRTDSTAAEAHSLSEQIEADKYLAGKVAARRAAGGVVLTELVPRRTA